MTKSIYIVGGIGALGCLAMSLMMHHLLKVRTDEQQSPMAAELEEFCGDQLAGPVQVSMLMDQGLSTMLVRMWAVPGVDRDRFARSASDLLWRRSYRMEVVPEQLKFEVFTGAPPRAGAGAGSRVGSNSDKVELTTRPPSSRWGRPREPRGQTGAAPAASPPDGAATGGGVAPVTPAAPATPQPGGR